MTSFGVTGLVTELYEFFWTSWTFELSNTVVVVEVILQVSFLPKTTSALFELADKDTPCAATHVVSKCQCIILSITLKFSDWQILVELKILR